MSKQINNSTHIQGFALKIVLISSLLFTSGCSISLQDSGSNSLGGIFKSVNQGNEWAQANFVPTVSGQPQSLGRLDANFLIEDPSDINTLYYGSVGNGLFYTYDAANTWRITTSFGNKVPDSLAVDPELKCTLYASVANSLYKSIDCTRTWDPIYNADVLTAKINSIIVNHYNNNIIYAGTTLGEIITSDDKGKSWRVLQEFKESVKMITQSPFDSRVLIAIIGDGKLLKSTDGGEKWKELNNGLKVIVSNFRARDVVFSRSKAGQIIAASDNSLLTSFDYGDTWGKIELVSPESGTTINSVALGSLNEKLIYYTTNTTFYRSIDGGEKWVTKKLPTQRAGWKLIVNPKDDNIIYLAVKEL
ncbi:hypothetical protein ISS03_05085 [Patescibacteria group bacterium]|nr:hypothetical protein [Patescibacteria group bacterium]